MTKLKVLKLFSVPGCLYQKDDEIEVTEAAAKLLIKGGFAEKQGEQEDSSAKKQPEATETDNDNHETVEDDAESEATS